MAPDRIVVYSDNRSGYKVARTATGYTLSGESDGTVTPRALDIGGIFTYSFQLKEQTHVRSV